jgi:hypothetical protein
MKTTNKNKSKNTKNKTIKNKIKLCNDFCENVYVYEIDKQNKEVVKGTNSTYNAKIGKDFRLSNCKKNFCNKDCKKKYKYSDKETEKLFLKNMKNNFITNMRPSLIKTMKTKGAVSYCDGYVYNPFNKNK